MYLQWNHWAGFSFHLSATSFPLSLRLGYCGNSWLCPPGLSCQFCVFPRTRLKIKKQNICVCKFLSTTMSLNCWFGKDFDHTKAFPHSTIIWFLQAFDRMNTPDFVCWIKQWKLNSRRAHPCISSRTCLLWVSCVVPPSRGGRPSVRNKNQRCPKNKLADLLPAGT